MSRCGPTGTASRATCQRIIPAASRGGLIITEADGDRMRRRAVIYHAPLYADEQGGGGWGLTGLETHTDAFTLGLILLHASWQLRPYHSHPRFRERRRPRLPSSELNFPIRSSVVDTKYGFLPTSPHRALERWRSDIPQRIPWRRPQWHRSASTVSRSWRPRPFDRSISS